MDCLTLGTRALLVVVLAIALVSKSTALGQFTDSLRHWRIVPARLVAPVAVAVLLLEAAVAVGLALAGGTVLRVTFVAAAVLFAGLGAAAALVLHRGTRGATCACFGRKDVPLSRRVVWRNAGLTGAAVLGAVTAATSSDTSPGSALVALGAGAGVGLLVVFLDPLLELWSPPDRRTASHRLS
ncbi:MauE/DoxX family redox-associated membrane protein [Luteipulveratus flavus]|uniref:MauE/DoxX family redox-associated membrane protein n=1 Tax=Luteipulveratus flavus TaxID=3031728 RepID=A0ABT6C5F5_9MICO|nr:MauE/DoxX family redox-associated membrane protein [Luteipulveratus sp. YIM 133296]MDF8263946.1 MauE/DoxX family redox-associated membrane protein [Luteipulveratus sp. YIM 133296]